jgi:hypothetical protein
LSSLSRFNRQRFVTNNRLFSNRGTKARTLNNPTFAETLHQASQVPFSFRLPSEFVIANDTLTADGGELSFVSNDTTVRITPTAEVCDFQDETHTRECLEETAKRLNQAFTDATPGTQLVQDENIMLQIAQNRDLKNTSFFSYRSAKNTGRFFVVQVNGERIGRLFFTSPIDQHLWLVEIMSPSSTYAFLNSTKKIKKFFGSLRFSENQAN